MTVKLVNKNYQTVLIVAIILFTGFVVFNAFTGELSKYTIEELKNLEPTPINLAWVLAIILTFVLLTALAHWIREGMPVSGCMP